MRNTPKHMELRRLVERLNELRGELAAGQKMLTELDEKRTSLQQTMLRIGGAIQVLEELLAQETEPEASREAKA